MRLGEGNPAGIAAAVPTKTPDPAVSAAGQSEGESTPAYG